MIALAISSFPGGLFLVLYRRQQLQDHDAEGNPLLSVGIGALVAVILAVTAWPAR